MSCQPEQVTAYVDGQLEPALRAELESHLATCEACSRQLTDERWLRGALRAVPSIDVPGGLEARVREGMRKSRPRRWRVLLPLAAVLVLGLVWGRGSALLLSWELSLDHGHCFGKKVLPAQVWGQDPQHVRAWFAAQGTELPVVPESANGLRLVGGRFCPLLDRKVAHLYYADEKRNLSLYVVPGPLRFEHGRLSNAAGRMVQLLRVGGRPVALVGEEQEDLSSFRKKFEVTVAFLRRGLRLSPADPAGSLLLPDRPDILVRLPVGL